MYEIRVGDCLEKVFKIWRNWIKKQHLCKELEVQKDFNQAVGYRFSPMTYKNPYIPQIREILEKIIYEKKVPFQKLELVVIDADINQEKEDDLDIQNALHQLSIGLNYLLLVTDRIAYYKDFIDDMYEDNGLVVQQIPKSASSRIRGNFILDFERSKDAAPKCLIRPGIVYLPIYKKPWEIGENLDIIVPVGYNTLVVEGILFPQPGEYGVSNKGFMEDKADRLDQEFRKG